MDELSSYGISTTGALIRLHADVLARYSGGYCGEGVISAAEKVGSAYGLMNLVRASLPLLSRGIVLLPLDLLSLHGLSPEKIYNKKDHDASKAVIKDIVHVASAHLKSGRDLCYSIPNSIRPAFIASACGIDHIIKITKKVDYDIYSAYLQRRNPLFIWSVLWKRLLRTY
uniref:Macro domain-containing protein n=1 Tax=Heterorhabditis bacteriophora TaxID=37862 RepID=A0A1I7WRM8_HETBA